MSGVLHALVRRLRGEDGSFLVEAVVSAALLLTIAGGAMLALDAASVQSGTQRSRAEAANVAQSKLEELRSMKFTDLTGWSKTGEQVQVDGTTYTVDTHATEGLVPTASGSGCDVSAKSAEALKLTATVRWSRMGNAKPVVISTMVAAPAGTAASRGSLVIQVTNRDGYGVKDLRIDLTGGPTPASAVTDVNGCVRLSDLMPAESGYFIEFSRAGWTTTPGNQTTVKDPIPIVAGATQTKAYQYDEQGGKITANFFYRLPNTGSTTYPMTVPVVSWQHPSQGVVVQPVEPAAATVQSPSFTSTTSNIGIYPDSCPEAQPPASGSGSPPAPWRAKLGQSVGIQMTGVDLELYPGDGTTEVWFRSVCGTEYGPYYPTRIGSEWRVRTGLPYGSTDACIIRPRKTGSGGWSARQIGFDNVPTNFWPGLSESLNIDSQTQRSGTRCGW